MKKWTCKQCGYTHYGEDAPLHCPKCGASWSEFYCKQLQIPWWKYWVVLGGVVILAVILFAVCSCSTPTQVNNTPVGYLDLNRYMGQWYELARFDHRYERGMTHCMAFYLPEDDGMVKVINLGKKSGSWELSEGHAKTSDEPGVLRVTFFAPFYSDYRILMLAPDYSYALVAGNGDNNLWILSRTATLCESTLHSILHEAQRRGYNTDDLIWVEQSANDTQGVLRRPNS